MVSTAKRLGTPTESIRVPYIIGDKYLGWFVFRRDFVATIPSEDSLATFVFDENAYAIPWNVESNVEFVMVLFRM